MADKIKFDLTSPRYFDNRELSWLDFNERVIRQAEDPLNPLAEQLSFLAIGSSNLDEFFMVRVAGLQDQYKMNVPNLDNKTMMTPEEQLDRIAEKNAKLVALQYRLYAEKMAECENYGIRFSRMEDLDDDEIAEVKKIFDHEILPTLTPLGIDAYRPFPSLKNRTLNLFVHLRHEEKDFVAIVPIPSLLKRIIPFKKNKTTVLLYLDDIIRHFLEALFREYEIRSSFYFRITRNADLELHEDGAHDLLLVIEDYLKKRKKGMAVRLEVDIRGWDAEPIERDIRFLMDQLELSDRDVYCLDGPLDLTVLHSVKDILKRERPDLAYGKYTPVYPLQLKHASIFDIADRKDLFFHHPYDSFEPVVEFIEQAANDPEVISIKQTLYRVSKNSPIVSALIDASENGKDVTVLVELKARFDEENNVMWAKELEEAGCHVIYGITGLKTHSKITLAVKRNGRGIRRYVHLGTGNYNDSTAKIYEDMGIITSHAQIGEDATSFFNYLSGYSTRPEYHHLHVSPFDIRDTYIEDIQNEIDHHKRFGNGHIFAKMNSLTSKDVIIKLYEASQAGVRVDLIIRGICCLIPGIPGVSENIRVRSIVGRFLEHSRIYYFHNNGMEKLYLSSADMMTRNMIKRVEVEFPVLDPDIRKEILGILNTYVNDNVKAWEKGSDNVYRRVHNDAPKINAQVKFMNESEKRSEQESYIPAHLKTAAAQETPPSWLRRLIGKKWRK
jgi:polyphosphate kinase